MQILVFLACVGPTAWANEQLVFGSFKDPKNAQDWAIQMELALEADFVTLESMTGGGKHYQVVTVPLAAQAVERLRVLAEARELDYWRLLQLEPRPTAQVVAFDELASSAALSPVRPAAPLPPSTPDLTAVPVVGRLTANRTAPLFTEDDLLLLAVSMGGYQLTETLPAYSSRAGLFFPLGELARLLDFAILVDPPARRAEGWFLSPDRRFLLDLPLTQASSDGRRLDLLVTQATFHREELYVRSDLLQKLLPLTLKVNRSDLSLEVIPLERFPFQDRQDREARRLGLQSVQKKDEDQLHIPGGYALFSPPSIDATLGTDHANTDQGQHSPWDLRLSGDLGYTGMQLFAGSNSDGRLTSIRTLFERKDPDGKTAGPLGATRSAGGDIYTPPLPLGIASMGGRGVMITSRPLDQASVFSTTDIRGELPLGYTVELYVNDVLRASQARPVVGNYEFLDIPLSYGVNLVRLVFYGPQGERNETLQRVNVSSGQLRNGQVMYSVGAAQEGVPLVDINHVADIESGNFGLGSSRMVGSFAYGLSDNVTITAGVGKHTPNAILDPTERQLLSGGLLSSKAGFGLGFNAAMDDRGGKAYSGSLGGRLFGVSLLAHHSEYSGNFVDEHQYRDLFAPSFLARSSELTGDWSLPLPFLDLGLPMSVRTQRSQFVDGADRLFVDARVSAAINRYFVSTSWQFQEYNPLIGESSRSSSGSFDASALVWERWQIRAAARFTSLPTAQIDFASILVDGMLTDEKTLHFGLLRQFGASPITRLQAGTNWLLPTYNISLSADYAVETKEVRILLQMAFSSVFDPLRRRYRLVRPGAAGGGNVALEAFIDSNGDGLRQSDEEPVQGITAQAGNWPTTTDENGTLLLTGLGDAAYARILIDQGTIPDPYLVAPAKVIQITPHPGEVRIVKYPLQRTAEATFKLMFHEPGLSPRGLSAVQIQLVSGAGEVIAEGKSGFDGILVLDRLPMGCYSIRIAPEQAERLQLGLLNPVVLTIGPEGGYVGETMVGVVRI